MATPYLLNGWYVAAWAHEVTSTVLLRTLFGREVMLLRGADGLPVALENRCPHRFAPLAEGVKEDGTIHCPYHGLQFNTAGQCVHNPHGPVPRAAQIRRFAVAEQAGLVWIRPGTVPPDDVTPLPDLSEFDEGPGRGRITGMLEVRANYNLIIDNLLDLSHVEYLHPHLAERGASDVRRSTVSAGARSVTMRNRMPHQRVSTAYRKFWRGAPEFGDKWSDVVWEAPATVKLYSGWTAEGGTPRQDGVTIYSSHFITPRTATHSYYFWGAARTFELACADVDEKLREAIELAFATQDRPMVESQQANIGDADLYDEKPILLTTDRAAGRRKKIMDRLLAIEGHAVE